MDEAKRNLDELAAAPVEEHIFDKVKYSCM